VNDIELILEFVETQSENAFRTIVERHAGMVHATAQRMLNDSTQAEEVTQAVFILLAKKARQLPRSTCLAGWLYRSARLVALKAIRAEIRRAKSHQEYARMNSTSDSSSLWNQLAPVLDTAMAQLKTADRDALVLRFFEDRPFAEVATAVGTTEAAAKMRVTRALEKLRTALARGGLAIPGAALLAVLSANASAATPVAFASSVSAVAVNGGVAASPATISLVNAVTKCLAMAKLKSAVLTSAIVLTLIVGAIFLVQSRQSKSGVPLRTLNPLAGDWSGTFRSISEGVGETPPMPVELSIRTQDEGRLCEMKKQTTKIESTDSTKWVHKKGRKGPSRKLAVPMVKPFS
jgi:RNA polymerase sigma factor (sigma-70 family)